MSRIPPPDCEAAFASSTDVADRQRWGEIVGSSAIFLAMLGQLRRVAACDAPVLIEGETGSGKELVARAIHYRGVRQTGPFVPVNCGALPDQLLEAELFGHEQGAFTDAKVARRGLVAEANGGTLFLDEVDTLSAKAQIALLRFLQDQRYRPLGSARELSTNVRLIAAANQPLTNAIQQGKFRSDLLYRLKVLHLALPPLRDRLGDAEQLALHFVRQFCGKYGISVKTLSSDTLASIRQHQWPGNVRELENWVHRELLMGDGLTICSTLTSPQGEESASNVLAVASFRHAKAEVVCRFERDFLIAALRQADGNVTRASQIAGKERRAFGKLLKKHGIDRQHLSDQG